jgi:hypothetical protein
MRAILYAMGLVGLGLTWGATARAATLAPTKASQVIELSTAASPQACPGIPQLEVVDVVQQPNGTTMTGFTIPPNQVLVITDASFVGQTTTGGAVVFGLLRVFGNSGNAIVTTTGTAPAAQNSEALANVSLRGVVVKSGTTVCVGCVDTTTSSNVSTCTVFLHGFLAKDL